MTRKEDTVSGARQWSQPRPQHVGWCEHAAVGASHAAALRLRNLLAGIFAFVLLLALPCVARAETVSIVIESNAAPRVAFGAEKLAGALKAVGIDPAIIHSMGSQGRKIYLSPRHSQGVGREGFTLLTEGTSDLAILHGDDSGALYGCLELAMRIRELGGLPRKIYFADKPTFTLRGTCV